MCAMMSCLEVRGTGEGHIEMLMSPHSGLGQLEGHRGWRHVSHDMDHREERRRVRGSHSG